jgi:hypothetical protein
VPDLPQHPSLEHLRKQAKARRRERAVQLSQAQHEVAREYGFGSWRKLVHHVQAQGLEGVERALVLADLDDSAFDDEGPTPLDCAVWGMRNNRADDGDCAARSRRWSARAARRGCPRRPAIRRSTRS